MSNATITPNKSWTTGKGFGSNAKVIREASGNKPPIFSLGGNPAAIQSKAMIHDHEVVGAIALDSASSSMNMDSGFFSEQSLRQVLEPVMQRFPSHNSTKAFPVDRSAGWNDEVEHWTEKMSGEAALICCSKFPRVEVSSCAKIDKIQMFGSGYSLCFADLAKSEHTGKSKESALMKAVIQVLCQLENDLAFSGASELGIYGVANNPLIPKMMLPYKFSDVSTDLQIRALLNLIVNTNGRQTAGVHHRPNAIIIPPSLSTFFSMLNYTENPYMNVLQTWLGNAGIKYFIEEYAMETAGVGGSRAMFLYYRDPDRIRLVRPTSIGVLQPFWDGVNLEVNAFIRAGSLWFDYPQEGLLVSNC